MERKGSEMATYRFSPAFLAQWAVRGIFGRQDRTFAEDAQRALRRYRSCVAVCGQEHVPAGGPFIVVSNHYQRPGMGAEWTGIAVTAALAELRPALDLRWMHTAGQGGYRLFDRHLVPPAIAACFMQAVARRYGFLAVDIDATRRAPMLREAYRLLHDQQCAIGIMPEGGNAHDDGSLGSAKEGAGPAVAWLAAGRVPVVPVAVHDAPDGSLVIRFGSPYVPPNRRGEQDAAALTADVMRRIARMLPAHLHGSYAEIVEVVR